MLLHNLVHGFEAVLFDFDGTLAPNLDLLHMRQRVIEKTLAFSVPNAVFEGRYIIEIIDAAFEHLAKQDAETAHRYYGESHQLILDIEFSAARETSQFPDTDKLLVELRRLGISTGVVTRNCREAVLLTYPELLAHTDVLIARDDTDHVKPDPRHLDAALGVLQAAPHRSVMVGDGAMDMRTGKLLSMFCVGVLTGSSDAEALRAAGADVVLASCFADAEVSG